MLHFLCYLVVISWAFFPDHDLILLKILGPHSDDALQQLE